jgi:hypothetical protein
VTLSPRALIGVAPALVVVAGSFVLSRACLHRSDPERDADAAFLHASGETVLAPSPEDEDRLHRVAVKQETVEDLLNGQMTFADALNRFETLTASAEDPAQAPGETEPERAINQLLSFLRVRANRDHDRYGPRLAELESEARSFQGTVN